VYLFSFSDTNFGGGTLQATLGKGYSGGKDVNIAGLGDYDYFGSAVALNAIGNRLAVGAPGDAGAGNTTDYSGAVHLFSFSDTSFSGGTLEATLGKGYNGGKNVNVDGLDVGDEFGSAVAFNATGDRLAVGALYDGGVGNAVPNSGAVYLFTLGAAAGVDRNFADLSGQTSYVSATQLNSMLSTGTAVTLQASNDITLNNAVTANNVGGDGGHFKLQAGRSILLNANITTDNGNFTAIANEKLANGVVDAEREAGAANIAMAAGTSIDAGTGSIVLAISDGAGLTNSTPGTVTLTTLTANRWLVYAPNPDSVIKNGITSDFRQYNTSYGGTINTATGNGFIYASAPGTLTVNTTLVSGIASHIYGDTPTASFGYGLTGFADSEDNAVNIGLAGGEFSFTPSDTTNANSYTRSYVSGMTSSLGYGFAAGTGLGYLVTPALLTVTANNASRIYGNTNPVLAGTISGFKNSETASVLSTAPSYSTTATQTSNVGDYQIVGAGGTAANYNFTYVPGNLSVTQRDLTLTANNQSKTYGATDPGFTWTIGGLGLVNGDNLTGSLSAPTGASATAGSHSISRGTLAASSNYITSFTPGILTVAKATLTATAHNTTRIYGNTNPSLTGTLAGFAYGENSSVLTTAPSYSTSAIQTSDVGDYAIVGAGGTAQNYSFSYVPGTLAITQRPLTISVSGSKVYDRSAVLSAPTFSLGNLVNGDVLTPSGTASFADWNAGSGKALTATDLVLTGAKAGNYTWNTSANGTGSITQLASVNWIGGSNGVWSDAANWFGGALPDNNNVAEVIIPATVAGPSSITITNPHALYLGNTAITANTGSFTLETTGGLTTGSGLIRTPYGRLSLITHSPMIIGSGGLQAASGITLDATTAEAGSTITLNGPVSTNTGSMVLAAYGNVTQNANISAPSVVVSSSQGNITVASSASTVAGSRGIRYVAPQGSVSSSASNFVGATPVITTVSGTTGESPAVPTTEVTQQLAVVLERVADTTTPVAAAPETPVSSSDAPVLPGGPAGAPRLLASLGQSIGGGDGQFGSQSTSDSITPPVARDEKVAKTETKTETRSETKTENSSDKREEKKEEKKEEKQDEKKMAKEEDGDGKKPATKAAQKKLAQCS
jgi:hypothetical protein